MPSTGIVSARASTSSNLAEGHFPLPRVVDAGDVEEDRRLFDVADPRGGRSVVPASPEPQHRKRSGDHRRLKLVMEEDPVKRETLFARLCAGWYIGSDEGKARLAGQVQNQAAAANAAARRGMEAVRWERLAKAGLKTLGKADESPSGPASTIYGGP